MESSYVAPPELKHALPRPSWATARAGLVGILLLAAALRLVRLGHESMWFDESLTVTTARLPLRAVLRSVEMLENMPPLYFYLMNLWARVAGTSDFAMRLPSALAGIAAVGVMYALGRRIGPRGDEVRFGLFAALLLAISRYHIAYCSQARSYSLMLLLAVVSCWSFMALTQTAVTCSRRWAVTYVLSSAAMVWMQPFSALTLLAQNVFYLARILPRRERELTIRRWLLMQGLIAISFGPWVNRQLMAARIGSPWMAMPSFSATWISYAGSEPLLIAVAVLAAVAVASQWRRPESGLWFALLLAMTPVALPIWASTPKHPLFVPRYGITALVGMDLVAAWGVVMLPRALGITALIGVAAMATPALAADLYRGTTSEHRADVRSAAAWVDGHAGREATYFCSDGLQSRVFEMYRRRTDLRSAGTPGSQQSQDWWLISKPTSNGRPAVPPQGYHRPAPRRSTASSSPSFAGMITRRVKTATKPSDERPLNRDRQHVVL